MVFTHTHQWLKLPYTIFYPMRHILSCCFTGWFILCSYAANSQSMPIYDMIDPANQNTSILFGKATDSNKSNTYLLEYFNRGTVVLTNGARLININLNYDLLKDNLITKQGEKDFILDKTTVAEFTVYDVKTEKTYQFKKLVKNNETLYAEELLVCNQFTVYKQNSIRLREVDPQVGYGSDSYKGKNNLINDSGFFISTATEYFMIERKNEALKKFMVSLGASEEQLRTLEKIKKSASDQGKLVLFLQDFCND